MVPRWHCNAHGLDGTVLLMARTPRYTVLSVSPLQHASWTGARHCAGAKGAGRGVGLGASKSNGSVVLNTGSIPQAS